MLRHYTVTFREINDAISKLYEQNQTTIMITCPCGLYPLAPHFYIVKLGFTGVYIFSYICSKT